MMIHTFTKHSIGFDDIHVTISQSILYAKVSMYTVPGVDNACPAVMDGGGSDDIIPTE